MPLPFGPLASTDRSAWRKLGAVGGRELHGIQRRPHDSPLGLLLPSGQPLRQPGLRFAEGRLGLGKALLALALAVRFALGNLLLVGFQFALVRAILS